MVLYSCSTIRVGMDDPDSQINIGFFDDDLWIKWTINSPIEWGYKNIEFKTYVLKNEGSINNKYLLPIVTRVQTVSRQKW